MGKKNIIYLCLVFSHGKLYANQMNLLSARFALYEIVDCKIAAVFVVLQQIGILGILFVFEVLNVVTFSEFFSFSTYLDMFYWRHNAELYLLEIDRFSLVFSYQLIWLLQPFKIDSFLTIFNRLRILWKLRLNA